MRIRQIIIRRRLAKKSERLKKAQLKYKAISTDLLTERASRLDLIFFSLRCLTFGLGLLPLIVAVLNFNLLYLLITSLLEFLFIALSLKPKTLLRLECERRYIENLRSGANQS